MSSEASKNLPEHVEKLVNSLLDGLEPEIQNDGQRILLDVTLNGVRCVVTRVPSKEHECVRLSPREREIARMITKGYSNKTIASILEISTYTVNTYIRRMFAKLQVRSRAALVAQMLKKGLIREKLEVEPSSLGMSDDVKSKNDKNSYSSRLHIVTDDTDSEGQAPAEGE